MWLQAGEERRDRVDVGLCVKNGGKGLYVPDFARPLMENGDAKGGPPLCHVCTCGTCHACMRSDRFGAQPMPSSLRYAEHCTSWPTGWARWQPLVR